MIFELLKFQVSNFSIYLSLGNAVSALQNGIVELGNGGKQMSRWCNQPIKMGNIGSIEPGLNTIKHMDFTKPRSTYFPNGHVRNAWRIQPPGYSTIAVGNVLPSHLQYSSKRRQEWQNHQSKIEKGIITHYQPFKIIYFSWGAFTNFHDFCMSFSRAFSGTPFPSRGPADVSFTEIVPYPLQLEVQLPCQPKWSKFWWSNRVKSTEMIFNPQCLMVKFMFA